MYSFIAVSNTSGNCSDGELRLEGGSDDIQAGTRQGRVEICINNAWGTICDNLFRRQDAKVVCGRLEGFQRDGEHCVTMARSVECKFAKATKVGLLAVFYIYTIQIGLHSVIQISAIQLLATTLFRCQ